VPVSLGAPAAEERRRNPLKCLLIVTGLLMLAGVPLLINQAHKQPPPAQLEPRAELSTPPLGEPRAAQPQPAPALHRRPKAGRRGKNAGGKHPKGDAAGR
jgi:hypothetical protein